MRYDNGIADRTDFPCLLRDAAPAAGRVATIVLGTHEGADDVVQLAMERAWRARRSYDPARPFAPWFLRIVANTARNDRRQRGRLARLRLRAASQAAPPHTDATEGVDGLDDARAVVAALGRLEEEDRTVLALRYVEQLSEAEVATILDCPVGTVKSRTSRAKERLRTALAELDHEEGRWM